LAAIVNERFGVQFTNITSGDCGAPAMLIVAPDPTAVLVLNEAPTAVTKVPHFTLVASMRTVRAISSPVVVNVMGEANNMVTTLPTAVAVT
jgi:hypothetical protein